MWYCEYFEEIGRVITVLDCIGINAMYISWTNQLNDWLQGAVSIRKTVLPGMAIPMLKIRRPNGRLIFNMENAIRR